VGPRGGLGSFEEEANLLPPPDFEPRILQPVIKSQRRSCSCNIAVYIELSPMLFNFALEYAIRRVQVNLRSGNACYHSVQNLLSSRLLSKNLKIKIYRTIILPVVLYGCETWSLTLREERKLKVFE